MAKCTRGLFFGQLETHFPFHLPRTPHILTSSYFTHSIDWANHLYLPGYYQVPCPCRCVPPPGFVTPVRRDAGPSGMALESAHYLGVMRFIGRWSWGKIKWDVSTDLEIVIYDHNNNNIYLNHLHQTITEENNSPYKIKYLKTKSFTRVHNTARNSGWVNGLRKAQYTRCSLILYNWH